MSTRQQKSQQVMQGFLEEEAGEALLITVTAIDKLDLGKKEFDLVIAGQVFKCERFHLISFISSFIISRKILHTFGSN